MMKRTILILNFLALQTVAADFDSFDDEKSLALTIIEKAISNENDEAMKNGYKKVREELQLAKVGKVLDCGTQVYAMRHVGLPNYISPCTALLDVSSHAAAQVLIHEAAHLAGHESECMATRWEHRIMMRSGTGMQIFSSYSRYCPRD